MSRRLYELLAADELRALTTSAQLDDHGLWGTFECPRCGLIYPAETEEAARAAADTHSFSKIAPRQCRMTP